MRRDENDPLVMYLVVRRRTTRPFPELAAASALAARRCRRRFASDERYAAAFEDWRRDSFRKVCLRAEPRAWEAMRELDHERVGDLACLPPRRRSERVPVLVRMQAYAGAPDGLPGPDLPPAAGELLLVVNTALPMSAGKALAQIAHGALLAAVDDDRVVRVAGAEGDVWDRLAGQADAVVRDGGLTELEPGSETVLALVGDD